VLFVPSDDGMFVLNPNIINSRKEAVAALFTAIGNGLEDVISKIQLFNVKPSIDDEAHMKHQ